LGLLPPDVCLRPPHQRGRRSPRHRHRQDQRPVAGRRQGQQGTDRAGAQAGPREPAPNVVGARPSRPAVAVSQSPTDRPRRHPCPWPPPPPPPQPPPPPPPTPGPPPPPPPRPL